MPIVVWAVLSLAIVLLLRRTPFGRNIYAIGNRERAAYLSGINTRVVLVIAFSLRPCSAPRRPAARRLLARPSRRWATPTCCPRSPPSCSAAPTSWAAGPLYRHRRGHDADHAAACVLSVMQMPEAGRQVIYGVVIIAMLLVYGRSQKVVG